MTFKNNSEAIKATIKQLEDQSPSIIVATVAKKIGVSHEGQTPKHLYGQIIRKIAADGTTGELNAARSDLMVLVNAARDAMKDSSLWTTSFKVSKPQNIEKVEPEPEEDSQKKPKGGFNQWASIYPEKNYDQYNPPKKPRPLDPELQQAIGEFDNELLNLNSSLLKQRGDSLVVLIKNKQDATDVAERLKSSTVTSYTLIATKILHHAPDAFHKYILPKFMEEFNHPLAGLVGKQYSERIPNALTSFINQGASVEKIKQSLKGDNVQNHPELMEILNIKKKKPEKSYPYTFFKR